MSKVRTYYEELFHVIPDFTKYYSFEELMTLIQNDSKWLNLKLTRKAIAHGIYPKSTDIIQALKTGMQNNTILQFKNPNEKRKFFGHKYKFVTGLQHFPYQK